MDVARKAFDCFYEIIKPTVFFCTKNDPEKAHDIFAEFLRMLNCLKLGNFLFDNSLNKIQTKIKISNAAGFNKNAEIPPQILGAIGFDRVVIGTVTADPWKGNPRPRVVRYPKTQSMINWMGLPGEGAASVAGRLTKYVDCKIPITANIAPTPGKTGEEMLSDLMLTVKSFRDNPRVDRFELNISCPNTEDEHLDDLDPMLNSISPIIGQHQELYLKISPDIGEGLADFILSTAKKYRIHGFALTNTTTIHDPAFILNSPGKGGASGDALYDASRRVQKMFAEKIRAGAGPFKIIACGGINSPARVTERVGEGACEIQLYTPLIFSGTGLIRKLRKYCANP